MPATDTVYTGCNGGPDRRGLYLRGLMTVWGERPWSPGQRRTEG